MLIANPNVPNALGTAAGVEQIAEGYYRFHLPEVADNNRVEQMLQVFEKASLEGAHLRRVSPVSQPLAARRAD